MGTNSEPTTESPAEESEAPTSDSDPQLRRISQPIPEDEGELIDAPRSSLTPLPATFTVDETVMNQAKNPDPRLLPSEPLPKPPPPPPPIAPLLKALAACLTIAFVCAVLLAALSVLR